MFQKCRERDAIWESSENLYLSSTIETLIKFKTYTANLDNSTKVSKRKSHIRNQLK